jgi:L-lactate utilization protein LutC
MATAEERAAKLLRDYRAEVVGPWFADVIAAAIRAAEANAAAREREECAKVADDWACHWNRTISEDRELQKRDAAVTVAAAIRARGTAP